MIKTDGHISGAVEFERRFNEFVEGIRCEVCRCRGICPQYINLLVDRILEVVDNGKV